uniref:Macaca fascicularis brain cDNA, clone: QflA-20554 n=1 Tax=Macaca fascicularis TaxID=9541 RepID=I7GND8_MACFA|nr:unnamed protein product [Macaca fascicularis]
MSYFCIASPWHMVWLMLHEQMNACQDLFSLTFLENLKVPDTSSHSISWLARKQIRGNIPHIPSKRRKKDHWEEVHQRLLSVQPATSPLALWIAWW